MERRAQKISHDTDLHAHIARLLATNIQVIPCTQHNSIGESKRMLARRQMLLVQLAYVISMAVPDLPKQLEVTSYLESVQGQHLKTC